MDGKQPETYILNRTLSIPHQQGTVAVTEEAEVMGESIVVDTSPVAIHESRHEQQEC